MNVNFEKSWDYENGFYHTSHPSRLAKTLAHYDLYKKITALPGVIIECGVFKGNSLIQWATFREILESQYSRQIIGFDAFGKFPIVDEPSCEDRSFVENFEKEAGEGVTVDYLQEVFKRKGFVNYELVRGNILETLPCYIKKHPELRIALLHIDVDVYAASKICLELLFERVVKGGLIVFDDYSTVCGETMAVDEFCGNKYHLEKLPYYKLPTFIVK